MSKRICKKCGSVNVRTTKYSNGGKCYVCEDCCCVGISDDFPEYTIFHKITASPEVLAKEFVEPYITWDADGHMNRMWQTSFRDLSGRLFDTRAEAIAATVEKLKKVAV